VPRDYKHRAHRRSSSRHSGVSPWLGVFAGLGIGLLVALIIYIKLQVQPVEQVFVRETLPPQPAPGETAPAATREAAPDAPKPPRFDFYTRLPEMEVVVPEQEITGKPEQGVKQVEQPGTYFLQVGSFRNGEQADKFKAELALLGLETSIQKITIDNTTTWHRVRVGPFSDLDALNKARRQLKQRGVESTLVKIKP
jgi:cell division protein FtsN